MKIVEYLAVDGVSPFRNWFDRLDSRAAAKVTTALIRMGMGNTSNVEVVGGGTKKRQAQDIETARERWTDYRKRKRRP